MIHQGFTWMFAFDNWRSPPPAESRCAERISARGLPRSRLVSLVTGVVVEIFGSRSAFGAAAKWLD
jgi:hypothetical protein